MKRHVRNILSLPSVSRAISEYRTEVFTQCISDLTCHEREDYLDRAKEIARWAVGVVLFNHFLQITGENDVVAVHS